MLSHVHLGTNDFERAYTFYAALMRELACPERLVDRARPWAVWATADGGRPFLIVGAAYDGHAATSGNGQMIALLARDRATVDRCHALALSLGGRCEGPPGLRPQYHANYYGAYFRDPDGNKLCVVCHGPVHAAAS